MKRIICCFLLMLTCIFCFSACGANSGSQNTNGANQGNTIEFVQNEITLCVGDSAKAEVVTSQSNVFVFFSIRDTQLATVSDDGVIVALAEGQTICYAEFGGQTAMCLVKITAKNATPMLSVSVPYAENQVTLYNGDTLDLKVSVKLGDAVVDGAQMEYVVANPAVASVENGVLNGLQVGTTTVTVNVAYEGATASLTLSVSVVEAAK